MCDAYMQEHLFLVCELLRANLYEFQKYNRESGDAPYFTNACIQRIARQVCAECSCLPNATSYSVPCSTSFQTSGSVSQSLETFSLRRRQI